MACPLCAGMFVVAKDHVVESENPLTLARSVVTPNEAAKPWALQILAPCLHHFFITNGEVVDAG